jgi:2-oxoglutarate/2-oxoacid ferredoxin oxidoreductase subunit alpha
MTRELWKGNEAIAEAAVRAGLEAYFGYPITPQTEILEYLSKRMPEFGRAFVQAESELAPSTWSTARPAPACGSCPPPPARA